MKQILQNLKSGQTTLIQVPSPHPKSGSLTIQTQKSLISPGTERMLVEFSKGNLLAKAKAQPDKVKQVLDKIKTDGLLPTLETVFNRLDEPLPLGYCNSGVVLQNSVSSKQKAVGSELKVGDRVVSNGPHAEIVCVLENLCAKIPDNVSDEQATFAVLGAIGLQGIRLAKPTLGEKFVVFGTGLIGLLTVQLLRTSGCDVMAVDLNEQRLILAKSLGAEICNAGSGDPVAVANAWTEGVGVDGVLITASAKTDDIVHQAAEMCRKRGRIVLVGVVGLDLRRADFYEKELNFQVSCSYGPGRYDDTYEQKGQDYPVGYVRWTEKRNFEAVLGMMASGRLDVDPLITDRIPFGEAEKAYEKISNDSESLGVILEYNQAASRKGAKAQRNSQIQGRTISLKTPISDLRSQTSVTVALIGSGNFAKMTLAPALAKTDARLKYVSARTNGAAAAHIAKKYGFENATTDLDAIWNDPEVNTVFITTQHNSHASLVQQALKAGKHVFVEKPLCLTLEELRSITEEVKRIRRSEDQKSQNKSSPSHPLNISPSPLLMVGFNRRFAPHIIKIKELLDTVKEPKSMIMTVNAGFIPVDHWTQDPEIGGGRIVGEACHFVDLIRFLAESPIDRSDIIELDGGARDTVSIQLKFEDGSIGNINYFANGNKRFPKERLEVFCGGKVLQLDNFRVLRGYGWKNFKKMRLWRQDKGHSAEVEAFVGAVKKGGASPIPFSEIVEVTETTIRLANT